MSTAKLILASRSPRRAALLREANYQFEQADPPFEDPAQPADDPAVQPGQLVVDLALAKAHSLLSTLDLRDNDLTVILGCDTTCVYPDGRLGGQPATREQARQMIRQFRSTSHNVVTGVALLSSNGRPPISFADTAVVTFGSLSHEQLESYLDSDLWQGKAGGYNLFDRQEAGWPVTVDDDCDPTTVVGLPMRRLAAALAELSIHPTCSGKPSPA